MIKEFGRDSKYVKIRNETVLPNKESSDKKFLEDSVITLLRYHDFRSSSAVCRMTVSFPECAIQGCQEWIPSASAQALEVVQVHGPDHSAAEIQLLY